MSIDKDLDQFYTKEEVSIACVKVLRDVLQDYYDFRKVNFLEPSAGTGSFIKALKEVKELEESKVIGIDLMPKMEGIVKKDFFEANKKNLKLPVSKNVITIGNPPFGKRSKLSIDFFNHAVCLSDTIAFIVPIQWNKWSVQSKLNPEFDLIYSETLQEDAFIFMGKSHKVRCVFQIRTRKRTNYKNLRIIAAPDTKHEDFEMYQYNNTKQAERYFYEDWDFAVPRQGYYDYTVRETDEKKMSRKVQWIFFKAKDEKILENLKKIDFEELARKNTTVFGFGKADVVEYYIKKYKK